jgi:N-acyl-D-amino-acid deacylase
MRLLTFVLPASALVLAITSCQHGTKDAGLPDKSATDNCPDYDLVIENGRVVDGTGNGWFLADVAIRDGLIVAVEDVPTTATATRRIDAQRRIVAPGFIDVHTHVDYDIYDLPVAENFLRNGVTTIITGNCGSSVTDVADYFATIQEKGAGVNVATMIGHNTVLRKAKGPIAAPLTEEQWETARAMVRQAMRDGAVGFSTGLIYTPGQWSDTEEIVQLQAIAHEYGGVYATHMRNESTKIVEAIEEALNVGRRTGSRVQISHFKMPKDVSDRIGTAATTLQLVDAARAEGMEVWVDQYPYTASSTSMSVMLPDWVLAEGPEKAKEFISDPAQRDRIHADMKDNHEVARGREDLSYAVITTAKGFPEFGGLNLKEATQVVKLRKERGAEVDWKAIPRDQWPAVTMADQYDMVMEIYRTGGSGGVFHTMSEDDVERIMAHPLVGVCSDSGIRKFGSGVPHPRGYGSNARVLGHYVRGRGVVSVEEAVRKMTSMPALAFRLEGRGLLRSGYAADVVIFDPATVTDRSTFEDPHHYSTGFQLVVVNGVVASENDAVTGALAGEAVRRQNYKGY